MGDAGKEIVAGSVAGGVGKLVEYPFDTVKVRLQSQSLSAREYSGAIDCFQKSLRRDGVLGMYKGISVPIVAAGAENAVLFSAFNYFDRKVGGHFENAAVRATACGSLSGIVASFVLTPIELVKCRIQVDHTSRSANVVQIITKTLRTEGLRQFWRGQTGTMLREGGGSASWFGTYHALKDETGSLVAGACAGVAYNLSLYPADSIKSRMQTESVKKSGPPATFLQTGKEIVRQTGVSGLYKGSLITCLRAIPSNAVIFTTHEYVRQWLG